ncbi:hypothetical protein FQA47_008533 [Oryzias melastigma]|uniref:Uncharacterized protein n=1 Tax=Oryzias melastigma TaxID=30732 RepID=A0A834BVJ2_ORYME|nr:hypothetical protein FQA47_008533 [Oryzias melastigma]
MPAAGGCQPRAAAGAAAAEPSAVCRRSASRRLLAPRRRRILARPAGFVNQPPRTDAAAVNARRGGDGSTNSRAVVTHGRED